MGEGEQENLIFECCHSPVRMRSLEKHVGYWGFFILFFFWRVEQFVKDPGDSCNGFSHALTKWQQLNVVGDELGLFHLLKLQKRLDHKHK